MTINLKQATYFSGWVRKNYQPVLQWVQGRAFYWQEGGSGPDDALEVGSTLAKQKNLMMS